MTRTLSRSGSKRDGELNGRNQVGGILWRQDLAAAAAGATTQDNYYWYDGLRQVVERQQGALNGAFTGIQSPAAQEEDFGYDATGNWDGYQTKADGTVNLNQSRTQNQANEITNITDTTGPGVPAVNYDAAGNMLAAPQPGDWGEGYEFTYDAWNRLVNVGRQEEHSSSSSSMESSSSEPWVTVATYGYDGLARRITKDMEATGPVDYYYSRQWQILEEVRETVTLNYLWGLRRIDDLVERTPSTPSPSWPPMYALSDLWNIVASVDSSLEVVERYGYSAFGTTQFLNPEFEAISGSTINWETTFCSYRLDSETGLYQVRYRYLHPALGRWVSREWH